MQAGDGSVSGPEAAHTWIKSLQQSSVPHSISAFLYQLSWENFFSHHFTGKQTEQWDALQICGCSRTVAPPPPTGINCVHQHPALGTSIAEQYCRVLCTQEAIRIGQNIHQTSRYILILEVRGETYMCKPHISCIYASKFPFWDTMHRNPSQVCGCPTSKSQSESR